MNRKSLKGILVELGKLSSEEDEISDVSDEDLNYAKAIQLELPIYKALNSLSPCCRSVYKKLPYTYLKKKKAWPFQKDSGGIAVAVVDPLSLNVVDEISMLLGEPVEMGYASQMEVEGAIDLSYHEEAGSTSTFIDSLSDVKPAQSALDQEVKYDLLDGSENAPVIRLLNLFITEAVQQRASDIHIEPCEEELRIRYRIDGVLLTRHRAATHYLGPLLARIKVMAKLNVAERRLPQDGRIKLQIGSREIDFRVSTLPVTGGERAVLRILDRRSVVRGMDELGMDEELLAQFRELLTYPEGIILVTGPTGSGKTTTLYSALCEMNQDERNIMTVEDPVEYNLARIAQMGVQPKIGLTFATGLRHLLRQDPDVIMVGEIRDQETAEIAIQSALTGHLVISTLHTNDAPSAITRLADMGIEPYLLSSSLIGVAAQRLVRAICPECKQQGECKACLNTGYLGRRGIYEMMPIDSDLRKQMVRSAESAPLREICVRKGMRSLRESGEALIEAGVTTRSEVLRVTRGMEV